MYFSWKEESEREGKAVERSIDFIVEEAQEGARLDVVLSLFSEDVSRSRIQRLIEEGRVRVDGQVCREKKHPVREGDRITAVFPEPAPLAVEPEELPIDIVYEDSDVLVINKARGVVVHPGAGNERGTLVNAILHHCGESLSSINGVIRPGIVHRIDKDTSGLLMVAKNDRAHQQLSEQLAAHDTTRVYYALVHCSLATGSGTVDRPLERDPRNRLRYRVAEPGRGKRAVTHYRVLESFGTAAYLELKLETGRTHQIRAHMAFLKHPLLGDPVYGPKNGFPGARGQMLHAGILGFRHPTTGEYLEFKAALPEDFQRVLNKLRGRDLP